MAVHSVSVWVPAAADPETKYQMHVISQGEDSRQTAGHGEVRQGSTNSATDVRAGSRLWEPAWVLLGTGAVGLGVLPSGVSQLGKLEGGGVL